MSVDKSPVYEVKAVPVEKVYANDYNPNGRNGSRYILPVVFPVGEQCTMIWAMSI